MELVMNWKNLGKQTNLIQTRCKCCFLELVLFCDNVCYQCWKACTFPEDLGLQVMLYPVLLLDVLVVAVTKNLYSFGCYASCDLYSRRYNVTLYLGYITYMPNKTQLLFQWGILGFNHSSLK